MIILLFTNNNNFVNRKYLSVNIKIKYFLDVIIIYYYFYYKLNLIIYLLIFLFIYLFIYLNNIIKYKIKYYFLNIIIII